MTILAPAQFYKTRLERAEELSDVLLQAMEGIGAGRFRNARDAANEALDKYDEIDARHAEEDAEAERQYLADEAADARRDGQMEMGT